jgi:2-polyprenyl-3-methyl-5-hydroxy-6-metoxy-1,4-benzoquinol methylase
MYQNQMNRYTTTFNTWNKIASAYQDTFMELDLYDDTYDIFCNHLSKKNAAILEIGCGPGNITKYLLLKNSRFNIKAIDAAAIQYANIGVGITSGAIVYKGSYLRSNELYHIQKMEE